MRTTLDRIRHMLIFELLAVMIAIPVVVWITGMSVAHIGPLTVAFSAMAMGWNYLYNLAFDYFEYKHRGVGKRTLLTRIIHALGFEGGLLVMGIPLVAWWLNISLLHAFVMDIGFMLFFLFYAFAFNWIYDRLFPVKKHNLPSYG